MIARAAPALGLAAVLAGCAVVPSVHSIAHVTPLPAVTARQGQSPPERDWDVTDCQAEAAYRTHYSPTDSPLANFLQKVFFWGTSGAAVGGLVTGLPTSVSSQASEGLIAGAGAGGITGVIQSWSGQRRFARAWVACIEARGYTVAAPGTEAQPPPCPGGAMR